MAAASSPRKASEIIAYGKDNKLVQLVYDTWTPRPHFIVVQRGSNQDANAAELQAAFEIISLFLRENSQFDNEAILSFHRGKWYQQHTNKWHAHLCVPKQQYLNQASRQIEKIPQNRQWNNAKTVEEGMNEYEKRKRKEYDGYQRSCIQEGVGKQSRVEKVSLSMFNSKSAEFNLVWMPPEPRIGIIARSPTSSTLASLYTYMSKVRIDTEQQLGRQDKNFINFGCHLCLYVCGQSGTNVTCRQGRILTEDGNLEENSNIVGYIQMDSLEYFQWLPPQIKQKWLDEFRKVEHFVRT